MAEVIADGSFKKRDLCDQNWLNQRQSFIFAAVRPAPHRPLVASGKFTNGHSLLAKPRNFLNTCWRPIGVKPLRVQDTERRSTVLNAGIARKESRRLATF